MSAGSTGVVLVVVTYRRDPSDLSACLDSLDAAGGFEHLVVVDNAATAVVGPAPGRTLIRPGVNDGFGAGANAGFAEARRRGATTIVLLNDDLLVSAGWLDPLVAELAAPTVGAVQPLLVLAAGLQVNSVGVEIGADGAGHDIGFGLPVADIAPTPRDIDVFSAGAVAFRTEFLVATHGFDERFFLYYEDVDLARRGAELGWSYRCAPASIVVHRKGASTSQLGDELAYLQERNRLWSALRHEPPGTIGRTFWLSIRRLRHRPRLAHLRGLAAGSSGAPVRLFERYRARRHRN